MTFIKKKLKKEQKQVAEFQPLHTIRKYFYISSILYKKKKELFEGVHVLKIPKNYL